MSKPNLWKTIFFLCAFSAVAAIGSSAQTLRTLQSFDGTDGASPFAWMVQGTDGNLYGAAALGGANASCEDGMGCGTVFKITAEGKLTTVYNFCAQPECTDGYGPAGSGLTLATNGNFYGTTEFGGTYGGGTVFEITPSGTLTTLYNFCARTNCADGAYPYVGLTLGTNGNFYGTTLEGGPYNCAADTTCGTLFEITRAGVLRTLHTFDGADGSNPNGLFQATKGNFYGTTETGGANDGGTVFEMTPAGVVTTLYSFCSEPNCTDGQYPSAGLVQATNGNFYGATGYGGANDGGMVFEITPAGVVTLLYSFCSQSDCTDGEGPYAGLVQATNGDFYGTTFYGGAHGYGTLFEITSGGTLTTLHSFDLTDGGFPEAVLVQATNGILYGTTAGGGADGYGTVFSLSVGLGPFVQANPTSGKVGMRVIILGNNLTGATSVTFNGVSQPVFTAHSSEITTTVPTNATTGFVQVTTASGTTLTSNVKFRVP
jgi:uncharacterized repeat protein (TIGR03803 family)